MIVNRRSEQDRGCLACMASVPCASLIAWIIMLVGIGGFTASMIIGVRRLREMLADPDWMYMMEDVTIGICVSVVVVGTFLLVVASLSSGKNSRHVFSTTKKNAFGRSLNIVCLIFAYTFHVVWLLICCALTLPLFLLILLRILYEEYAVECINLQNYGFPNKEPICDDRLYLFWTQGKENLICFGATFVSAVLVAISMVHFLIAIGANYKHLKETVFATYNAYNHNDVDDVRVSRNSLLETKM
ncbi:uncharacterized protein LOC106151575 isoform X2 [Lingula anatina]|uniref:Uncharacterized protein LOC106151575 isoform X2 n=1 Tax=Lingula anatina TaxID=7574 RepID=A0A1S3H4H4_LINAN|nr:uncharacterized protein LOC106151575 isoform X2 [Lingula anatina]|eukprot:XP_013380366.1 uncharacterized protein LOC106151575 isoform X2 [Lingula anatina]